MRPKVYTKQTNRKKKTEKSLGEIKDTNLQNIGAMKPINKTKITYVKVSNMEEVVSVKKNSFK